MKFLEIRDVTVVNLTGSKAHWNETKQEEFGVGGQKRERSKLEVK